MFEQWLWQSIPVTLNYLTYVAAVSCIVGLLVAIIFGIFFYFHGEAEQNKNIWIKTMDTTTCSGNHSRTYRGYGGTAWRCKPRRRCCSRDHCVFHTRWRIWGVSSGIQENHKPICYDKCSGLYFIILHPLQSCSRLASIC